MDARTALKKYADTMIKLYGANYVEHWTMDDRETFDILARKARAEMDKPIPKNWERSAYLRRVLGVRDDVKKVNTADRMAAWTEHVAKYGNGVSGTLRRTKDSFGNWITVVGEDRNARMCAGKAREARYRKSEGYVTNVTAADMLAAVRNG